MKFKLIMSIYMYISLAHGLFERPSHLSLSVIGKGATIGGGGSGGPDPPPKKKKLDGLPQHFDDECDYRYVTDCSPRNWVYHPYFVLYNNVDQGIGPQL